jgi:hypothetical protein
MKNKKTPKVSAPSGIIPHSGGENVQLSGFDGRDRVAASPTGGTRTADILSRPGKNVGADLGWKLTPPDHFAVNDGPPFRSGTETRLKKWLKQK